MAPSQCQNLPNARGNVNVLLVEDNLLIGPPIQITSKSTITQSGNEAHSEIRPTPTKGIGQSVWTPTQMDEIMVWACAARTKRFAYCAEFTVRFLQPATPGVALTAVGRLVEDRRGRIFQASGELTDPVGTIHATATGKYLPIKPEDAELMAEDFVGGPPQF